MIEDLPTSRNGIDILKMPTFTNIYKNKKETLINKKKRKI